MNTDLKEAKDPSQVDNQGKSIPGRGTSKCKGPEVGASLWALVCDIVITVIFKCLVMIVLRGNPF